MEEQVLNGKFFVKEHTKPLFKKQGILSVQDLYTYHCYLETFKVMKFRAPMALFTDYELSERKPTLIINQVDPQTILICDPLIYGILSPPN